MSDLQAIVWCVFVLLSGMVGFLAGVFYERDKQNEVKNEQE